MENWEWPQYLIAVPYVANVLLHSYVHGLDRTGKFSGPTAIIGASASAWIIYMGGFWS